jgi:aspartate 1-decarboxylase
MLHQILTGKIHRATVTDAHIDYVGSVSIDVQLMEAAGIAPYEQVHVVNITNGQRLITYTMTALRNSGTIAINGAAAHHCTPGDRVIILAYGHLSSEELKSHRPKLVLVSEGNSILEVRQPSDVLDFLEGEEGRFLLPSANDLS